MMNQPNSASAPRVLLADSDPSTAQLVRLLLSLPRVQSVTGLGVRLTHVQTAEELEPAVRASQFELIVCDRSLPGRGACAATADLRLAAPDTPILWLWGEQGAGPELSDDDATRHLAKAELSEQALIDVLDWAIKTTPNGRQPPAQPERSWHEGLFARLASLAEVAGTATDMVALYRALRLFAEASAPCDALYVTLFDSERQAHTRVYAYADGREEDVTGLATQAEPDRPDGGTAATRPAVVADELQAAATGPLHAADQPRSSLVIPMRVLGRSVGTFEIQSRLPAAYTPEHATAMRMAAQVAAIATENSQLLQRERRRRREAEESEERYRMLSELASDFAYAVGIDDNGQPVGEWATGSLERITGLSLDQVRFESGYPSFLHHDDRPIFAERIANMLKGETQTNEYRIVTPTGAIRWMRDVGRPVWDAARGRTVRIIGAAQDITDRKQAELALTEQAAELAGLYRASAPLLNSANGIEHVAQDIALTVTHEFALADCGVLLVDDQRTELRRVARAGQYEVVANATLPLSGPGLTVAAVRTGETIYAPDVTTDPRYVANDSRTRSELAVPLIGSAGVIGVLDLQSPKPNAFDERDQRLLSAFAKRAGLALANTQLFSQTRQHLAELEVLNKISSSLRVAASLQEMLPRLLDSTLEVLGASAGNIALLDEQRQELHPVVNRGWFSRMPELILKPGEGIAGTVLATAEPFISREFARDERSQVLARDAFPPGWGGACLPIRTSSAVVATMFVMVQLPRELTASEMRLLTTLSEIAGNAIHRTRLHEQTEQRLQQIIALHAIDTAITSSLDLHVTLSVLLDQVTNHLHVDAADLLLLQPASTTLEYAAGRGFRTRLAQRVRLPLGEGYAGRAALERRSVRYGNLAEMDPAGQQRRLFTAEHFVAYYGVPLLAKGAVKGVLELFHRAPLAPGLDWFEFLEAVAGQAALALDNAELFRNVQVRNAELTHAYDATIEGWSQALDLRDKETEGHTRRVTTAAVQLAQAMGLTEAELVHLRRGALLHDIGKMGIPDRILLKPGPLTDEEWEIMRRHPTYAFNLLSPIEYLRPALDIPYCHHEWWNGAGYPRGIKGHQIPLAARIFAVVDVWDALTSDRPYRAAWSPDKVRAHLLALAGTHLDPEIVSLFLAWQQAP